jgi:hypothetical protein
MASSQADSTQGPSTVAFPGTQSDTTTRDSTTSTAFSGTAPPSAEVSTSPEGPGYAALPGTKEDATESPSSVAFPAAQSGTSTRNPTNSAAFPSNGLDGTQPPTQPPNYNGIFSSIAGMFGGGSKSPPPPPTDQNRQSTPLGDCGVRGPPEPKHNRPELLQSPTTSASTVSRILLPCHRTLTMDLPPTYSHKFHADRHQCRSRFALNEYIGGSCVAFCRRRWLLSISAR